jgi:mannose-6-phosphate isomerase-like protein (cupin superfamily)
VGYSIVRVHDIEPAGPGGAVRFVRRQLGVQSFGVNWFELAPNIVGREHDEIDSEQEEVVVVVSGSGVYRIDGEEVPVDVGTFSASTRRRCEYRSPAQQGWR